MSSILSQLSFIRFSTFVCFFVRLPSRVGVGYRFLDPTVQAGLAKKIRSHLSSAASYHKQKSLAKENDGGNDALSSPSNMKSHIHDETVHITLTK